MYKKEKKNTKIKTFTINPTSVKINVGLADLIFIDTL